MQILDGAHAVVSNLDANRLHEDNGVGGCDPCVRVFPGKQQAMDFAATMIRERADLDDDCPSNPYDTEGVLHWFQDGLDAHEEFNVVAVVQD